MNTKHYDKKKIQVMGKEMAYVEVGEGDPIVFFHGNPTSSYLWRNIIPYMEKQGRCIAPDLIGMGDSEKISREEGGVFRYHYANQYEFLSAFLDAIGVTEKVTLVTHDWGGGLAHNWALNNPEKVARIAFMETVFTPLRSSDISPAEYQGLAAFRSEMGEELVLEQNKFVEELLPAVIIRDMNEEDMREYIRPFSQPGEDRQPTLSFPRCIPIDGHPVSTHVIAEKVEHYLSTSPVPKLFVNAEPGTIVSDRIRGIIRNFPNVSEVKVEGLHFIQEDCPDEIGKAISEFIDNNPI